MAPPLEVRVPGFLPSTRGLHFPNYYPHEPELVVHLPFGKTLPIGDAANGMCGGMAFTVRDYYEANLTVTDATDPPAAGTPLYQFIVARLFDSFNLPFGLHPYIQLMEPAFPDVSPGLGIPSRASVMLNTEWPNVKADLDAGHPAPLGLVKIKSTNLIDMSKHHQVVAYGYELDGTNLTLHVYDPNYPNNDDVQFSLSIASTQVPVQLTYSPTETVYCFFRTHYAPRIPPTA
jgi:hypothetical protein